MKAGERAARALLKRSRDLAGVKIKATIPAIIIPPGLYTPDHLGREGARVPRDAIIWKFPALP